MSTRNVSLLFYVSAVYDGLLGLVFLIWPRGLFATFQVPFPNHFGYVQFPAMLLLIFGAMFLNIARDPSKNRGLILYGIFLKVAYCSTTFWYWFTTGIPFIWKPFAIFDALFGVLFFAAYRKLSGLTK